MPQMAPLWWELLYMTTTMMLILTAIIIYHSKNIELNSKIKSYKKMQKNWKW
uniref:ATP synthase F0 subunit 8 n=1 Tax=Dysdercus cingulatus TaxID=191328 RepID=B7SMA4_9HEMI|nr:ATP synthase F0 subunit 8 [Dysdercus cingulatus]ABZ01998.1 ATP synthase F0 subunit 8 [Dysdercus cingulatus]